MSLSLLLKMIWYNSVEWGWLGRTRITCRKSPGSFEALIKKVLMYYTNIQVTSPGPDAASI